LEPVPAATETNRAASIVVEREPPRQSTTDATAAAWTRAAEALHDITTHLQSLARRRQKREQAAAADAARVQPSLALPLLLLLDLSEAVEALAAEYERALHAGERSPTEGAAAVLAAVDRFRSTVPSQLRPVHQIRASIAAQLGLEPGLDAQAIDRRHGWGQISTADYIGQLRCTLDALDALLASPSAAQLDAARLARAVARARRLATALVEPG
jgi:hypothetical protein